MACDRLPPMSKRYCKLKPKLQLRTWRQLLLPAKRKPLKSLKNTPRTGFLHCIQMVIKWAHRGFEGLEETFLSVVFVTIDASLDHWSCMICKNMELRVGTFYFSVAFTFCVASIDATINLCTSSSVMAKLKLTSPRSVIQNPLSRRLKKRRSRT